MKHLSDFRKPLQEETKKPAVKPKTNTAKEKPPFVVDNLAILKNIVVKHKADTIYFSDKSELDIEPPEANAILSLYARLTKENKKKVEMLLTKGVSTVMRLVKFSMNNA